MLNRLTISALLKSVIAVMAACVVAFLVMTAWESWGRLQTAARISVIADASAHAFKAMSNLRTDRATTSSNLGAESRHGRFDQDAARLSRHHQSGAAILVGPRRDGRVSGASHAASFVDPAVRHAEDLADRTIAAIGQPKASRRAALGKEYADAATTLLQTLEKLVTQLSAAVSHNDPVVDQLLAIKQIAWQVRDTGGQAAVLLSQGLNAGRLPPEARQTYAKFATGTEYSWKALETVVAGTQLPAGLVEAMAAAKTAYFEPQYMAFSERLLNAMIAGEKTEVTSAQWKPRRDRTARRRGHAWPSARSTRPSATPRRSGLRRGNP